MRKVIIGNTARQSTKAAERAFIALGGEDAGGKPAAAGKPGAIVKNGDGRPTPLIGYPGSKAAAGVVEQICRQMPLHTTYIEPFAGFAAVFRKKRPAAETILIDKDASTVAVLHKWLASSGGAARVVCGDALFQLSRLKEAQDPRTLLFVDPPYLKETVTRRYYVHNFDSVEEHDKLLTLLLTLPCRIMLTHYRCPLYTLKLGNVWRWIEIPAMTRGGKRIERLWMNFPEPTALHDTRFTGVDFRERERIKRKRARWLKRFAAMGQLERQAVAQVLVECDRASVEAAMRSASPVTTVQPIDRGR